MVYVDGSLPLGRNANGEQENAQGEYDTETLQEATARTRLKGRNASQHEEY